ncbi:iron hydrogenase [Hyaloraphidium curvatum]|nr:iron hydrogenase [Hyaloraphidium curvatum]
MSSGLSLALLNDYIAPSVECIKPVETLRPAEPLAREIRFEDSGAAGPANGHPAPGQANGDGFSANGFALDGYPASKAAAKPVPAEPAPPATINLTDCLACSGCITTAESVLVAMQSHKDLATALDRNARAMADSPADPYAAGYRRLVVTLSPQSRASIANKYGMSSREVHARLAAWLRSLGVHEVWDLGWARELALEELAREFGERWDAAQSGGSSAKVDGKKVDGRRGGPLPILAASCPGFVCYLETTHPAYLPHLSSVRSPVSSLASLLKARSSRLFNIPMEHVWHASIQPCYDRKLEASRPELGSGSLRDTDTVITTGELETFWREMGLRFPDDFPLPEDPALADPWYRPLHLPLSSSDASLPHLLLHSLRTLFATPATPADLARALESGEHRFPNGVVLSTSQGRNADVRDWAVSVPDGAGGTEERLRMAQSYGFRNIQNLLRKLPAPASGAAPAKSRAVVRKPRAGRETERPYHFVEVMACPSGCLNGGGQLRPDPTPENPSGSAGEGWLEGVRARYNEEMAAPAADGMDVDGEWEAAEAERRARLAEIYALLGEGGSDLLRTTYRGVEEENKEAIGLGAKW